MHDRSLARQDESLAPIGPGKVPEMGACVCMCVCMSAQGIPTKLHKDSPRSRGSEAGAP